VVSYGVGQRRVCEAVSVRRSTYRNEGVAVGQTALRIKIRDLAWARVSYGYRCIHVLFQWEGWKVNDKRVYRPCKLEVYH
jgi:putative transposase